jgi:hypothetical protein
MVSHAAYDVLGFADAADASVRLPARDEASLAGGLAG